MYIQRRADRCICALIISYIFSSIEVCPPVCSCDTVAPPAYEVRATAIGCVPTEKRNDLRTASVKTRVRKGIKGLVTSPAHSHITVGATRNSIGGIQWPEREEEILNTKVD